MQFHLQFLRRRIFELPRSFACLIHSSKVLIEESLIVVGGQGRAFEVSRIRRRRQGAGMLLCALETNDKPV